MERFVLSAQLFSVVAIIIVVGVCAWLFWIVMLLVRWLKEKKRKKEESKKELEIFILAVSNGDTIQFVKKLPPETKEEDIKRAVKEHQKGFGEEQEIYCIRAECKDSAFFELARQLKIQIRNLS